MFVSTMTKFELKTFSVSFYYLRLQLNFLPVALAKLATAYVYCEVAKLLRYLASVDVLVKAMFI